MTPDVWAVVHLEDGFEFIHFLMPRALGKGMTVSPEARLPEKQ